MKAKTNEKITKEKIEKSSILSTKVKNANQESKVKTRKSIETKTEPNYNSRIFHKETIQITKKKIII